MLCQKHNSESRKDICKYCYDELRAERDELRAEDHVFAVTLVVGETRLQLNRETAARVIGGLADVLADNRIGVHTLEVSE